MSEPNSSFQHRLTALIRQIYPDQEVDALSEAIVGAFWPDGSTMRKRGRVPGNRQWS